MRHRRFLGKLLSVSLMHFKTLEKRKATCKTYRKLIAYVELFSVIIAEYSISSLSTIFTETSLLEKQFSVYFYSVLLNMIEPYKVSPLTFNTCNRNVPLKAPSIFMHPLNINLSILMPLVLSDRSEYAVGQTCIKTLKK